MSRVAGKLSLGSQITVTITIAIKIFPKNSFYFQKFENKRIMNFKILVYVLFPLSVQGTFQAPSSRFLSGGFVDFAREILLTRPDRFLNKSFSITITREI